MPKLVKSRTAHIEAPAEQVWKALTDPELTIRYVGRRVRPSWLGDHIAYLAPYSDEKTLEGGLVEVYSLTAGAQTAIDSYPSTIRIEVQDVLCDSSLSESGRQQFRLRLLLEDPCTEVRRVPRR